MKNKLNILFSKTFLLNSLMTEFLILMKPAHRFAVQKQWAGFFYDRDLRYARVKDSYLGLEW